VADQNHITVIDLNSGEMLGSASIEQTAMNLAFAGDGSLAAYQIGSGGGGGFPFAIPTNAVRTSPKDAKNNKGQKIDMNAIMSAMANAGRGGAQQIKVVDALTGADKFSIALEGQPAPPPSSTPQNPFAGSSSMMQYPVIFSPNGRLLAVRDWNQQKPVIKIVDASAGTILSTIDDSPVRGPMTFSADGKKLAAFTPALDGNSVRILDVPSGSELKKISIRGVVTSLTFHPSGRFLITLAQDDREIV